MTLHTVLVDGPLALRLRRFQAAREAAHGQQILTLPLLASRLAGGFIVPAGREVLFPAITKALAQGELEDLGRVADLPGTTRAVLKCLDGWWQADLSFNDYHAN